MDTQNNTKRRRPSRNNQQVKDLAFHLSAVMQDPQTPDGLYNAIGVEIAAYASSINWDSAEMIAIALSARRTDEKVGLYPARAQQGQVIESQQIS